MAESGVSTLATAPALSSPFGRTTMLGKLLRIKLAVFGLSVIGVVTMLL